MNIYVSRRGLFLCAMVAATKFLRKEGLDLRCAKREIAKRHATAEYEL